MSPVWRKNSHFRRLEYNIYMKPIYAWAVVKEGKLDALEIYEDKDVVLNKDEKLIRVIIKPYEENTTGSGKRNKK